MKGHKVINPHIYSLSLWGGILCVFVIGPWILAGIFGSRVLWSITGSLGLVAIINAGIYSLISLYRCWSILQGSTARTTPGAAVGFLFLPIFNFYWIFVAIRGLAKDADAFLESRNINENKIDVRLSLVTCIVSIIPYVNLVLSPLLFNILIYQWAKFYNFSTAILSANQYEEGIARTGS